MADMELVLEGHLTHLPGVLRTAACVNPQIELQLSAKGALQLARALDRANQMPEMVLIETDRPMTRAETLWSTIALSLCAYSFFADLVRDLLAALQ